MSWGDLQRLDVVVRPLTNPPPLGDRWSQFRSTFSKTTRLLLTELRALEAQRVVLELDLRERDIRLDGFPRADARPTSQAVGLSFESKHGPLRYATGEYNDWKDNLRAIALAMEALRAVDRYGVSKRGEQYQGWKAIPVSTDSADQIVTAAQASEFLYSYVDADGDSVSLPEALRRALFATHPDRGGNAVDFRRAMRAKEVLGL